MELHIIIVTSTSQLYEVPASSWSMFVIHLFPWNCKVKKRKISVLAMENGKRWKWKEQWEEIKEYLNSKRSHGSLQSHLRRPSFGTRPHVLLLFLLLLLFTLCLGLKTGVFWLVWSWAPQIARSWRAKNKQTELQIICECVPASTPLIFNFFFRN